MQRVLSTAALLGLLIATAAAFAITERLKLVKSPIYGTHVSKRISPTCGCARGKARVSVILRRDDDVTVTIRNRDGDSVATLASDEFVRHGRRVFAWNGRTDAGERAPDGVYRPEFHFARQHRTILLPNPITLDTRPPRVLKAHLGRATISPDGDGIADSLGISYTFDSPAHAAVYLGSRRILYSHGHKAHGALAWHGRVDGKPLPPGTYLLALGGVDLAGNVTPVAERATLVVRVRYIQLAKNLIVVGRPGVRFGDGVDTDAKSYVWTLDGKGGVSADKVLVLRAPSKPGTYTLVVGENGHTSRAKLVVERKKKQK